VRRKAILLASVAGVGLIAAQPAAAQGFYFSASGGAAFTQDDNVTFRSGFRIGTTFNAHFDSKAGFLLEAAMGLDMGLWLQGLKFEMATSFQRNNVGGRWTGTTSDFDLDAVGAQAFTSGPVIAHLSTFALMANAWYEFDIGSRFKPYFGGGLGWARSDLDGQLQRGNSPSILAINPFNGFHIENSGFAYQLGAGISTLIMPGTHLGIGYRYFDAPDTEVFFGGKLLDNINAAAVNENRLEFDGVSHSVLLTLTVDIY